MFEYSRIINFIFGSILSGSICVSCADSANKTQLPGAASSSNVAAVTALPAVLTEAPIRTPAHLSQVQPTCWPIERLTVENEIEGSLVISNGYDEYIYWDIDHFQTKTLGQFDKELLALFASPDGNFLTVLLSGDTFALIYPAYTTNIDLPASTYYSIEYLNDGRILLIAEENRSSDSMNYEPDTGFTDEYYIYDPKTGQLKSFSIFLPDFSINTWDKFVITYSSDMRYVLYHSVLAGNIFGGFTLLDLTSREIIWTVPEFNKPIGGGDGRPNAPVWKPNATSLTYIELSDEEQGYQNFFNISLDGVYSQITRVEQMYESNYILFSQPQWSFDGRYLAFKIQEDGHSGKPQLTIWDDKEKELLTPCLPVERIYSPFYQHHWSFDNEHIIVGMAYSESADQAEETRPVKYRHFILDISNQVILEIPHAEEIFEFRKFSDDMYYHVFGWLDWEIQ